eukprot:m.719352 g.719352  ORF g.719352 m.719352 type:complete len:135 (+) comp22999_c1_seq15:470-874(+)
MVRTIQRDNVQHLQMEPGTTLNISGCLHTALSLSGIWKAPLCCTTAGTGTERACEKHLHARMSTNDGIPLQKHQDVAEKQACACAGNTQRPTANCDRKYQPTCAPDGMMEGLMPRNESAAAVAQMFVNGITPRS